MPEIQDISVQCPYCGEQQSILLEDDLAGDMVQDCAVCCRPWQLRVRQTRDGLEVDVTRAQ